MKLVAILLSALLAFSVSARADIANVAAADLGNNGGTTNSYTVGYPVTAGSSVLYITVLGSPVSTGNNDVTGVTYGGVSGSLVLSDSASNAGGNNRYKYIYAIYSPPSGTNNVVVSKTTSEYILAGAVEYKNSITHGPADSTGLNNGGVASSVTGSTTVVANNAWVLGLGEQENNANGWFAGSGDFIRVQDGTFFTWALFDSNGPASPGSYSMSISVGGTVQTDIILDMLSFAPFVSAVRRSLMHVGQ